MERKFWIAVTVALCVAQCTTALVAWSPRKSVSNASTYENGFRTDLVAAVEAIGLSEVVYTSGIERYPNGDLFLNVSQEGSYVGDPSPELDARWEALESAIELRLPREQTRTKVGDMVDTMDEPGMPGWYRVSVDVIHSLHCVNQLRKAVYAHHYYKDKQNDFWYMHMNHCLEHIRQAIQCHSDLTPLAYSWDEHEREGTPVWSQPHTCRDFTRILEWDRLRTADPLEVATEQT